MRNRPIKKVEIHVAKQEHIMDGKVPGFSHGLDSFGITYTIVVDKKIKNRRYPYITVNDKGYCIKRVIRMKQGGNL